MDGDIKEKEGGRIGRMNRSQLASPLENTRYYVLYHYEVKI